MIYTSNFSNIKNLSGTLVSIARGTPLWYHGLVYRPLLPPWELITNHKSGIITEGFEEYTKILNSLDKDKVIKDLDEKILLCWCGKGKFCHRHIVAKWLSDYIEVKEVISV